MSLRYMGTKRALAPVVREAALPLRATGQIADLFSGMGSVATCMAPDSPVLTNDALEFTTAFARAKFRPRSRASVEEASRNLYPAFARAYAVLKDAYRRRISSERTALQADPGALRHLMEVAPHVGNSSWYRRQAQRAAKDDSIERYQLAVLYFSCGYFSTAQAAQLDALRYAIDQLPRDSTLSRDWLLAAWLGAAAVVINAPGHSAQFLKPTSASAFARIGRQWRRSVWSTFLDQLDAIQPIGTSAWRKSNRVHNSDALELVSSTGFDNVTVVYADPPYTKDQYSRFYHVYETLFRYDFPVSTGQGRYRGERFRTPFSLAESVEDAFRRLFGAISNRSLPLVLSYPDNGLLQRSGQSVTALLTDYFSIQSETRIALEHSTLGASSGAHTKVASEGVYVCVP